MQAHASAITTLWIAMGLILLPSFFYLSQGSVGPNSTQIDIFVVLARVFYIYLFIESIIASIRLKHVQDYKKYVKTVALIVTTPFLLIVALFGNEYTGTNTPFLVIFCLMIGIQLLSSIKVWKLLLEKSSVSSY